MIRVVKERIGAVGLKKTSGLMVKRLITVVTNLGSLRISRCRCCGKRTLFINTLGIDDGIRCIRCSAQRRYEMLADAIRAKVSVDTSLEELIVVELDPDSPLKPMLSRAKQYIRTFYDPNLLTGAKRKDGSVCQDITRLGFEDNSVDLIISSEVLEHVPDLELALSETYRVLKPTGVHLFTIPTSEKTRQRAKLINGEVEYLQPPEYHLDPLNQKGILVFWEIGDDIVEIGKEYGLVIEKVFGPEGPENKVVWSASKGNAA